MKRLPTRPDDIEPRHVERLLRGRHPDVRVRDVRVLEVARCGDGRASTADRIKLAVDLEGAQLPRRMVLKTILLHPALRFGLPMILGLSRAMDIAAPLPVVGPFARPVTYSLVHAYQRFFPHAPAAMYENEVRFYRDLRSELEAPDFAAPRGFGATFSASSDQFWILMEDLDERGATFPNATQTLPRATLDDLVRGLASLHATYWGAHDPSIDWVPTTRAGGMAPVFDAIGLDLIEDQVAKHPFKRALIEPLDRSVRELWEATWAAQDRLAEGPQTLCHGDAHVGNTFRDANGAGGYYDFQLLCRGSWAHDLSYLLATAVDPDVRRRIERDVLAAYLEELAVRGVPAPTFDRAWNSYRVGMIWGLVIGWLITPPVNYGERITSSNVSRMVTAICDHAALELAR